MLIKNVDINDKQLVNKIRKFIDSYNNIDVKQTIEWGIFRNEEKLLLYVEDDLHNICMYCNAFIVYDREVEQNVMYIVRGPVYNEKIYSLEDCLNLLCDYAKNKGYKYIRTNPKVSGIDIVKLNNKNILFIPKNEYFRLKESPKEATLEVKCKNDEILLNSYHYKTRYNIRRSIKYGVNTTIEDSIDLDEFYRLYNITSTRHDFSPHPKEYFKKILEIYKDKIVFGVTRYENKTLAMSINIKQCNTFFYLYGVSSDEERNKFACYNLHYTMINYALNNNFEYYNFGGVFSDDDDITNKDYGLLVFKSRFCTNGFKEYMPDILIKLEG